MKAIDATYEGCNGCLFESDKGCTNKQMKCIPSERDDGRNVIFVNNIKGDK